jgi:hypothetical protein
MGIIIGGLWLKGELVADIRQRNLFQRKIMGLKQEKKAMAFVCFAWQWLQRTNKGSNFRW